MNFVLNSILSFILLYKYVALFLITFLSALALPLPATPSLMAAAAFAEQGYFNFWLVVLVGSLGNIAGDNLGYWLCRRYGRTILYKIGWQKILNSLTYEWLAIGTQKHSAIVIFLSRFNALSTISVNIIAGLSAISYWSFLCYGAIGEIVQVFIYAGAGLIFGNNWQSIYNIFGKFTLVIALLIILVVILISKRLQKMFKIINYQSIIRKKS